MTTKSPLSNRSLLGSAVLGLGLVTLSGCQSLHATPKPVPTIAIANPTTPASQTTNQTTTKNTTPVAPVNDTQTTAPSTALTTQQFSINGKIGITTPKQTGSAFYVWTQEGQNFAIDIAGALNAGQTKISYNGQSATLTNEKGTINADSPEELLFRATGWQAPISQLPYWIQGQTAPSDSKTQQDRQGRLTNAQNGDWTSEFTYSDKTTKLPSRLIARHPDGYKIVMTINRLK